MPRPNHHIDQKLIKVGLKILAQNGLKAISVREICKRTNVNLGMFTYLFQTKDNYLRILFETVRNQLLNFLDLESVNHLNSFDKLRYAYQKMIDYSFQNKELMRSIMVEAALDKTLYESYLKKGVIKPWTIPFDLIDEAQKSGSVRADISKYKIHHGIIFGVIVPILLSDCKIFMKNDENIDVTIEKQEYIERLDFILKEVAFKDNS